MSEIKSMDKVLVLLRGAFQIMHSDEFKNETKDSLMAREGVKGCINSIISTLELINKYDAYTGKTS